MSLLRLALIVALLMTAVSLALFNPTMEDYLRFVEGELVHALDKMDRTMPSREQQLIRQIFGARGKQLLEGVVRPHTTRQNWGIFSRYKTNVLDTEVVVIGIAGRFLPIKGVEEVTLKIGRMTF